MYPKLFLEVACKAIYPRCLSFAIEITGLYKSSDISCASQLHLLFTSSLGIFGFFKYLFQFWVVINVNSTFIVHIKCFLFIYYLTGSRFLVHLVYHFYIFKIIFSFVRFRKCLDFFPNVLLISKLFHSIRFYIFSSTFYCLIMQNIIF